MTESILLTIKTMLGISLDDDDPSVFNNDLLAFINLAFSTLNQIGVGPVEIFSISSDLETWSDFSDDAFIISLVKPYVYLKTRILFDPPASSIAMDAANKSISELEWRLNSKSDYGVDKNVSRI